MIDTIVALWLSQPEWLRTTLISIGQILAVTITVILCVAYTTLAERKVIGYMQVRIGPNRVGPFGLLQPFADVIKMLLKEVVVPSRSNHYLFVAAPLLTLTPAFAAWAVMSLWPGFAIADIDAGVLYILALAGFGAYGIILAGWAANSKYAFLGAMRSAAQIVASVAMQSTDYRMAVVDFKDFNDTTLGAGTDYSFRAVVTFTEDPTRIINGINTLGTPEGAGGGTDAESVYDALMNTIDGTALGGWRSGQVNRIILLIGDGPPHDPEPPTGNTLATVVNAASLSPSKRIFAVQIGADPLTSVYYTSLAGGTGGAVTHAADALGLAAAVIENIELITHVAPSIYVSDLSRLPGWDASAGTWDEASGNIGEDPLFIAGYYLSQTASGQGRQSPAVDAGSGPADARDIALANRTTRTDGVADANTVDMGYHYAEGVTLFTLTAEALPSEVDGLIHGSVSPAFSVAYAGAADNVVRLVACLLYTSPSPRDRTRSRMPSSA